MKFAAQFVDVMRSSRKNKEEEIVAQVIFDELKIKCGVVYNPKTGIPTGITASKNNKTKCFVEKILDLANDSLVLSTPEIDTTDQSLEKEASNKLDDDTNSESDKTYLGVATMVNIFRLRTAFNQRWNVGYFFNCGSLDGDEVLRQLLIVIIACELVGIVIKLQMSDAGGGNMKAIGYLTND